MSRYTTQARNHILELLKNDDICYVVVRTSRLSSSIYNLNFWKRFVELLYDDEKDVKFTFNIPTDIDYSIFDKIDSQIKKVAQSKNLGKYDKGKIDYSLEFDLSEENKGYRTDGIILTTSSDTKLKFEMTKTIQG